MDKERAFQQREVTVTSLRDAAEKAFRFGFVDGYSAARMVVLCAANAAETKEEEAALCLLDEALGVAMDKAVQEFASSPLYVRALEMACDTKQ